MKLLINASNLVVGGGMQVALSFLEELKSIGSDDYCVFISSEILDQLNISSFPSNFQFHRFLRSPAYLFKRSEIVGRMHDIEAKFQPNAVFTVLGPSYWKPKAVHVMGFALGWAINPETIAYTQIDRLNRFKIRVRNRYRGYFVKRDANYLITETTTVKNKLIRYDWARESNLFVVGNTYHRTFEEECTRVALPGDNRFRLVTISAMYPHKNLGIIRRLIPILERMDISCRFYLTLPNPIFLREFSGLDNWVTNLGPVGVRQCPAIYRQCHALFLPTLLECFSASYPEAMKMDLPIMTSDLDFAHEICGDAAEYFDPLDPQDIAKKISDLINSQERQQELIELGRLRLQHFPTPRQRAEAYLDICQKVANS